MQEETLQIQITEYEKPLQKLIGKSIMDVFYYEINYSKPTWNQGKFHSLDYGIELQMSDDTSCYFIWDSIYHQYDLKFSTGSITSEFKMSADIQKNPAKGNLYWEKRVLKKIKNIKSFWSYWTIAGKTDRTYYPQDICIEFENNTKVWISAIEIMDTYTTAGSDHITVIFDEMTRNKYHIGDRTQN